jgi:hypothetical protein
MLEAARRGFDGLILIIDQDNQPERGVEIKNSQEDRHVSISRALGVAVQTFDAWMIADENALTHVLGIVVAQQKSPEQLSDPKNLCAFFLNKSRIGLGQSEMYARVALLVDVLKLEERYPLGFTPFATRVRNMSRELGTAEPR